jgi:hypothetical protein
MTLFAQLLAPQRLMLAMTMADLNSSRRSRVNHPSKLAPYTLEYFILVGVSQYLRLERGEENRNALTEEIRSCPRRATLPESTVQSFGLH